MLLRMTASKKPLRRVLSMIMYLCVIHGGASVLEICLICRPLAAQWDPNVGGACGNQIASFVAIEVIGMILDVAVLASPIPLVSSMKISKVRKLRLALILDAGAM